MNTTRRNFIKASALAAFFAGTDLFASTASAAENSAALGELQTEISGDRLFYLTAEDFKKYIGAQFSLIGEKDVVNAELSSVAQSVKPPGIARSLNKASSRKLTKETFTLSFRVPSGGFSQATYQVWHPNLGQFDLFLVPSGKGHDQILVHAVINRI
jgi:hypothetical protein